MRKAASVIMTQGTTPLGLGDGLRAIRGSLLMGLTCMGSYKQIQCASLIRMEHKMSTPVTRYWTQVRLMRLRRRNLILHQGQRPHRAPNGIFRSTRTLRD